MNEISLHINNGELDIQILFCGKVVAPKYLYTPSCRINVFTFTEVRKFVTVEAHSFSEAKIRSFR